MPSQTTEIVIETATIRTKIGGAPKYTSANIPNGIKSPTKANLEMVLTLVKTRLNIK